MFSLSLVFFVNLYFFYYSFIGAGFNEKSIILVVPLRFCSVTCLVIRSMLGFLDFSFFLFFSHHLPSRDLFHLWAHVRVTLLLSFFFWKLAHLCALHYFLTVFFLRFFFPCLMTFIFSTLFMLFPLLLIILFPN